MQVRSHAMPVAAMAIVVLGSNILVQFPMGGSLGRLQLADILTWGAFTYPFTFLVTDLTNRWYGAAFARRVVYAGFAVALLASVAIPPVLFAFGLLPFETAGDRLARIACASGAAFLLAQLLDVLVFSRLRQQRWWRAPALASLAGSLIDTLVFFSLAFAPVFGLIGPNDAFSLEAAPLLGVMAGVAPRWVSWALGDFCVKVMIAFVALIPYRVLMQRVLPYRTQPA